MSRLPRTLGVLFFAGMLAATPALCGAQVDPASTNGNPSSQPNSSGGDAPPIKNFFDWLLKPQPPRAKPGAASSAASSPTASSPSSAASSSTSSSPSSAPAPDVQSAPPTPRAAIAPVTVPSAVPASAGPTAQANTGEMPSQGGTGLNAGATPAAPITEAPAASAPAAAAPSAAGTVSPTPPPPAVPPVPAGPRAGMALILPAKAEGFARAAEVTRKGFMAAREQASTKAAVQVIETDGSAAGAQAAYQEALAKNVAVIVGPLTKTEVVGLQGQAFPVPTLMLNSPDGPAGVVPGLYMLSLSVEMEARAAAEAAYKPGATSAVIVATPSPLSRRASAAFQEAWQKMGGTIKDVIEYTGNPVKIKYGVDKARGDLIFLAADNERARMIKPFLGRNTPVIATSQVYSGVAKVEGPAAINRPEPPKVADLNGLRFMDMPWLHQPDHPAAMVYAHPEPALAADLARLYALGIDAYRVAEQLTRQRGSFEIDGVTGRLAVHEGLIDRKPIEAEYRDGVVVPLEGAMLAHGDAGTPGVRR